MITQDELKTAIKSSSADAECDTFTSTITPMEKPENILQGTQWILAISMEPLLAFVLLYNDYQEREWYFFVAHYYTWFVITNTIAFWVDPSKRGFWPPFRVIASVQIMLLIGNLVLRNVE